MYLAIYKDLTKNKTRYYYIKDDKLYYDEYSGFFKKTVKVKSLDDFFSLFKNTKDSLLVKNDGSYYVYFDSDYYKRYVKDGKEDFIKFFEENGVDALFYLSDVNIKSAVKQFLFKTSTTTIALIASVGLFKLLDNPQLVNSEQDIEEIISEEELKFTDEDIVLAFKANTDSLSFDRVDSVVDSNIISDVLTYYDDTEKSILYSVKLNDMEISYYESEERPGARGYYNNSNPSTIHILEGVEGNEQYHVFQHEFVHLLQDSNTSNYLTEPVAELMSSEYFDYYPDAYLNEVLNLKLLIRTIGREPILKSSFGGDSSELFKVLEDNLDANDYERMKTMIQTSRNVYKDDEYSFNLELKGLIEKLYFNIYGTEMKDLDDYEFLTYNYRRLDNKNITTVETMGEKLRAFTDNKCFYVKDSRKFLKESDSNLEPTITYEVPYYEGTEMISGSEKIDYYKKEITLDEFNSLSNDMNVKTYTEQKELISVEYMNSRNGDLVEYYKFNIDGKIIVTELESAVENGWIKYYVINTLDELTDSSDSFSYAFSNLRITKKVDPILNRYDEDKSVSVSHNVAK